MQFSAIHIEHFINIPFLLKNSLFLEDIRTWLNRNLNQGWKPSYASIKVYNLKYLRIHSINSNQKSSKARVIKINKFLLAIKTKIYDLLHFVKWYLQLVKMEYMNTTSEQVGCIGTSKIDILKYPYYCKLKTHFWRTRNNNF